MRIRLLQWNVWYRESAEAVLRVLRDADADILCLQELTTTSAFNRDIDIPARIIGETGMHGYFQVAQSHEHPEHPHTIGNGIFSRFPQIACRSVAVQDRTHDTAEHDTEARLYLEAQIDLGHGVLTVGTTHLSYAHRFAETPRKSAEMERLSAQLITHSSRFIFTGDLNVLPDSPHIQSLLRHLTHCGPPFDVPTWTTKPAEYAGFHADGLRWRLDYSFATPDVRVIDAHTVDTHASDHLPVLVTIDV